MFENIKRTSHNGITLIALAVTIVVLLILSGITISVFFDQNGVIMSAQKTANDTETAKDNAKNEVNKLANDLNGNSNDGLNATKIAANPSTYYGKKVNYTSGSQTFQIALGVDWKIFYADESHIYLIASDYVPVDNLPFSTQSGGAITDNKPIHNHPDYYKTASLSEIISDYSGSSRIDKDLQYLNRNYFKNSIASSSTNNSMKAVAYMLDTQAWKWYKDSNGKADFVIGGPTIEMILDSYSQRENLINSSKKKKYQANAVKTAENLLNGYQISTDYGSSFKNAMNSSAEYLSSDDSLYVIDSTTDAYSCWIASPSNCDSDSLMYINNYGFIGNTHYNDHSAGFRPVVALKTDVTLIEQKNGSFNIK